MLDKLGFLAWLGLIASVVVMVLLWLVGADWSGAGTAAVVCMVVVVSTEVAGVGSGRFQRR